MKTLLILIGTRPNFIKVTRFKEVVASFPEWRVLIVHTGQHYDKNMADVFFKQFGLEPDYFLDVQPASPASQMGEIMIKLEQLIGEIGKPNLMMVPGDVNSTLAGALVANKMDILLAHLESGLRSNDRAMPEEINRILTDEITDHYFVTEKSGLEHLKSESKKGKMHFVGNTMIDTLVHFEDQIDQSSILEKLNIKNKNFVLITLHRPSNVDHLEGLEKMLDLLKNLEKKYHLVFPLHPRTMNKLKSFGLEKKLNEIRNLINVPPLGYFEFQKLVKHAKLVITDSGGIQEETTFRKVPCITLRDNTERPITCELGTNTLLPFENDKIFKTVEQIESGSYKKGEIPELWDGKTTERILEIISKEYN